LLEDKEFEGVQWNQDPRNRTLKLRTLNQLNHMRYRSLYLLLWWNKKHIAMPMVMVKLETVRVERRRERKREELCVDGLLYNLCILSNQWLKLMSPSWTNTSFGPGYTDPSTIPCYFLPTISDDIYRAFTINFL
jgi:hypothetical protein